MRLPFHYGCLAGFGHFNPLSLHFRIELHLDRSFPQIVAAKEQEQEAQARNCRDYRHEHVEVELSVKLDEFDGQEARVINDFH